MWNLSHATSLDWDSFRSIAISGGKGPVGSRGKVKTHL